jgi:hypothetical protein
LSDSEYYIDPLTVRCPVCGEEAGKSCLDYAPIPFRYNKDERNAKVMRSRAHLRREPHEARMLKANANVSIRHA